MDSTYLVLTQEAHILNEPGTARLTLHFVHGTHSVRVERCESDGTGYMTPVMARTIGGAQYAVLNNKTKPLRDRYIDMLREQYGFVTLKQHLEPLVRGFDCITSEKEADSRYEHIKKHLPRRGAQ